MATCGVVVPVMVVMLIMRMLVSGLISVLLIDVIVLMSMRFTVITMPVMIATAVALHALRRLSNRRAQQRDGKQRQKNCWDEQTAARHKSIMCRSATERD